MDLQPFFSRDANNLTFSECPRRPKSPVRLSFANWEEVVVVVASGCDCHDCILYRHLGEVAEAGDDCYFVLQGENNGDLERNQGSASSAKQSVTLGSHDAMNVGMTVIWNDFVEGGGV